MNHDEHLKENPALAKWYARVTETTSGYGEDGYQILPGWPDAEFDRAWSDYIYWCHDQIDGLVQGDSVGGLPAYDEWRDWKRAEGGGDDLGFCHTHCDLCGALPGDRHAAVAMGTLEDYICLSICGDCLSFIVNGNLPEDM